MTTATSVTDSDECQSKGAQKDRLHTYSVEPVVDEVLDVLAHSDLSHELVLVSVHSSQLTNVREDVLKTISKLKFNRK